MLTLMVIVGLSGIATLITGLVIGTLATTPKGRDAGASIVIVGVTILLTLLIMTP